MTSATGPETRCGDAYRNSAENTCGRARSRALIGRGAGIGTGWLVVAILVLTGCSLDSLLKNDQLPPDVTDPAVTKTPAGALAAYRGTVDQFRVAFGVTPTGRVENAFVLMTGLLSDELQEAGAISNVDRRLLPESSTNNSGGDATYGLLHRVRAQAGQAIGLLTTYVPEQPALVGHVYALEGYAEIFLAELFCSGIPLSTLDFKGDWTYQPGSSTAEVFAHALALFDTALTLAGDNTHIMQLAQVGKARALLDLDLDSVSAAAAAVATVLDDYHYDVTFTAATGANAQNFTRISAGTWEFSVADHEGSNGLDYRSSGDPRTAVTARGTYTFPRNSTVFTVYHPNKYAPGDDTTGASPIVLASAVEARLIAAEAALKANPGDGQWLTMLNALRTNGTQDGGVYQPGTGGIAGLAPLADPGTAAGRVDLLFRERAFWLFLTGHRQGDLRRLIRQYGRSQDQIYPTGPYPGAVLGETYGNNVDVPIPAAERAANPLFTGCAPRGE